MLSLSSLGTQTATLCALYSPSPRSSRRIRKADLHCREGRQENKTLWDRSSCLLLSGPILLTFSFLSTTELSSGIFPFQAVINMTILKVSVGGSYFLNLLKCSSNIFIPACGYSRCSLLQICTILVSYYVLQPSTHTSAQSLPSPTGWGENKERQTWRGDQYNIKTVW